MTAQEFEHLEESEKKILLFEAKKVAEKLNEECKNELFQIEDFYVETTVSKSLQIRRTLKTYLRHQLDEMNPSYDYGISL